MILGSKQKGTLEESLWACASVASEEAILNKPRLAPKGWTVVARQDVPLSDYDKEC